jgi:ribonuclease P protein component
LHDSQKFAALDMALIYSSKEVVDYKTIENAVRKILSTVAEDL